MINEIFCVDCNCYLIDKLKEGKYAFFVLENGDKIDSNIVRESLIKIKCAICNNLSKDLKYSNIYFNPSKKYVCKLCACSGEKNPFYGKKHSLETRNKIAKSNTGGKSRTGGLNNYNLWIKKYGLEEADRRNALFLKKQSDLNSGENNNMYGVKMKPEWIEKSIKGTAKWREKLTEEEKLVISKNMSCSQKKLIKDNPEQYRAWKVKAAKASATSHIRYKINKLEEKVQNKLLDLGLVDFKYSVILNYYQFDFGNKKHRVLLEVQGDYWHGNENIYKEFNEIQKSNKERDLRKVEFAEKYGFKLFHIWEEDINKDNFTILNKIKEYIDEI